VSEKILKTLTSANGQARVLIVERTDGRVTYRTQLREPIRQNQWGAESVDCGLYDSAETAEAEAKGRVWWLAATSN
jgi:hypothetical protein